MGRRRKNREIDGQMDRQIDREREKERKRERERLASYPFKILVSPESRDDQSEQTPSERELQYNKFPENHTRKICEVPLYI